MRSGHNISGVWSLPTVFLAVAFLLWPSSDFSALVEVVVLLQSRLCVGVFALGFVPWSILDLFLL
jgi:hypothetical protein